MTTLEHRANLDDWDTEVLPKRHGGGDTIITLRTREVIIENQSRLFRVLTRVNKVLLIVGTLALLTVIGLSLAFSILMLNNLHVLTVMQHQTVGR